MKFQKFSKKLAFFADFCFFFKKNAISWQTSHEILKISLHLKCLKITSICPNEVVQRLRERWELDLGARKLHLVFEGILCESVACTAKKVVKVTFLLQKTWFLDEFRCTSLRSCFSTHLWRAIARGHLRESSNALSNRLGTSEVISGSSYLNFHLTFYHNSPKEQQKPWYSR